MMLSYFSQSTYLESCYGLQFLNHPGLRLSYFSKRFIPGFTNEVQNFIRNNLLSSCTGGFSSKHLSKWSVSSNYYADNVRFGSQGEFADMVQNFYLVAVLQSRRDWLWKEGILLWHFALRLYNNDFIYKKMHKNATRLLV